MAESEEVTRLGPEAVRLREESQTEFEGLAPEAAAKLAAESFPDLVDHPAGGPPQLGEGQSITAYPTDYAAQVNLGAGQHGVIESSQPIALETAPGKRTAIDLSLSRASSAFAPAAALLPVALPSHIAEGATLPASGVSLTPADEHGDSLGGGEGQVAGATVFYAATGNDTDTLAKPTTYGLELSSILRSERSPRTLYFHVAVPAGAALAKAPGGQGAIEVVKEGQPIAVISAPEAHDAAGAAIPAPMSFAGDLVTIALDFTPAAVRYPVAVDPKLEDPNVAGAGGRPSNWHLGPPSTPFTVLVDPGTYLQLEPPKSGTLASGQDAFLSYQAQGDAKIFAATVESAGAAQGQFVTSLRLSGAGGGEKELTLDGPTYAATYSGVYPLCAVPAEGSCMAGQNAPWESASEGNAVSLRMADSCTSTCSAEGQGTNYATLDYADVGIFQAAGPTVSFDEADPQISSGNGSLQNPLYKCTGSSCPQGQGPRAWLGPDSGAVAVQASDPGVGISELEVSSTTGSFSLKHDFLEEGQCSGVMCFPELPTLVGYRCPTGISSCTAVHGEAISYNPAMPEGDMTLVAKAKDSAGLAATAALATVGVDAKPPSISVGGALSGEELPAGRATVEVQATDGEGTTPSSGVREVRAEVEGRALGAPESSCHAEAGPCTATATWPVNAADWPAGKHQLIVTAIDNANNQRKEAFPFWVRAATPVAAGPGQIDPSSGELSLQATDVSLGQGLGVSRSYGSRHLQAGAEGPLGPQWRLSLGGLQTISELPEGSVLLNGAAGGQTLFYKVGTGEYEPPRGDQNLKLEAIETERKVSKYVLKDPKAGSATTFEAPSGYAPTPTYDTTFASKGSGSLQLEKPMSIAPDGQGNLWVADYGNNRVEEMSPEHVFIRAVGTKGSGEGQMESPFGVAANPRSGLLYVTDQGNHRVEVYSTRGAFVRSFAAPAEHAFGTLAGVAVAEDGNVYVADESNNRIDEFSERGEYEATFAPPAPHGLDGPVGIAVSGQHLYVTNELTDMIDELGPKGEWLREFGGRGGGNGEFSGEPDGIAVDPQSSNLFVTDYEGDRVQELSPEGTFLAKFGAVGESPGDISKGMVGIAADAQGHFYIADSERDNIDEWEVPQERAVFLPTVSEGTSPSAAQTYSWRVAEVAGRQVIEPAEELAPKPAGAECEGRPKEGGKLTAGCRALFFEYATATSASGETEGQWGSYAGRLEKVLFAAYNPATKTVEERPVAAYEYDQQGRLRAEWDPRIEPALKTTYGYDEGLVTAISPPGQEPWVLTYGELSGDVGPGRLIKYTRPGAATALTPSAPTPIASGAPGLTGTAAVGVRMAVSAGTWENGVLGLAFQWQRCDAEGEACTPIPGAVNQDYTPTTDDIMHTLRARVSATNAAGSTQATSAPSAPVNLSSFALAEGRSGSSLVRGPDGNVWFTAHSESSATVGRITPAGELKEYPLAAGVTSASAMTAGSEGDLWLTASGSGGARIDRVTPATGEVKEYPVSPGGTLDGLTQGREGDIWFTTSLEPKVGRLTPQSGEVKTWEVEGMNPLLGGITMGAEGDLYFTVLSSDTVGKLDAASGEIKALTPAVPTGEGQAGILTGPEGDIYYAATGAIGKLTPQGSFSSYPLALGEMPTELSLGPEGDLVFTTKPGFLAGQIYGQTNHSLERMTLSGQVLSEYDIPQSPESSEAVVGSDGELYYGTGSENEAIQRLALGPVPGTPAEAKPPQPGSTIDYGVPVSGAQAVQATHSLEPSDFSIALMASTVDSEGDVWAVGLGGAGANPGLVMEYSSNGRVLKRIPTGFCLPTSVTANASGEVFVTEVLCAKVQEYNWEGKLVGQFFTGDGEAKLSFPMGLAPDGQGHLFELNWSGAGAEVWRLAEAGTYESRFGAPGAGAEEMEHPRAIAYEAPGSLWVADEGNNRLDEYTTAGKWVQAIGWGVADGKGQPETCTTSCQAGIAGAGEGQLDHPYGVAADGHGHLFVADAGNGRIAEYDAASGAYLGQLAADGGANGQPVAAGLLHRPTAISMTRAGNLSVADLTDGRITEYALSEGAAGAPHSLGQAEAAAWGQTDDPVEAVAIFPPDEPQSWPATDYRRAAISYLDYRGRIVNTASPAGAIATAEYNEAGEVTRSLDPDNRLQALAAEKPQEVAEHLSTESRYNLEGTELLETTGPEHAVKLAAKLGPHEPGSEVNARERTVYSYDEGAPAGEEYGLQTKVTQGIELESGESGEERTSTTSYAGQDGLGWKLRAPTSTTADPKTKENESALALTHTTIYYEAGEAEGTPKPCQSHPEWEGMACETRSPEGQAGGQARDGQAVYYSAKPDAEHPACGGHPEWEGMACESRPAKQPETNGLPALAEVLVPGYNLWGEAEKAEERFGSVTRVKRTAYDAAGRETESEVAAVPGLPALPAVKKEYNPKTGTPERELTRGGEGEEVISAKLNALGELESYTDASGAVTDYEYDEDGRPTNVYEGVEGAEKQKNKDEQGYRYDSTTGALIELTDSAAGAFKAAYDPEGQMTEEVYPNGMIASYTHNEAGETTALAYAKPECEGAPCTIYADQVAAGAHGEALSESSTLESLAFAYDPIGRLVRVNETPAGKGCTSRLYAYDAESERTSLATREPGTGGSCAAQGGKVEAYSYDEAGRLTGTGIEYDALGNMTATPASDAGGHALASSYYADSQVATEAQEEAVGEATVKKTLSYTYDPAGRTLGTVTKTTGETTAISHYAGPGSSAAWTSEGAAYTVNVAGIDGTLSALAPLGGAVTLEVHDLKGNVVGTTGDANGDYTLDGAHDSTEFGVPGTESPLPGSGLAWLGAGGVTTHLASGVIAEGGSAYVPEIGRVLQTDPIVPPGADAEGSYSGAPYVTHLSAALIAEEVASGAGAPGRVAEREAEARQKAEQAAEDEDPACTLKVVLGRAVSRTGTEWVYARAWGECGSRYLLPQWSELEVCLVMEIEEAEYVGPFPYCGWAGSGFDPTNPKKPEPLKSQLYAHRHLECESGIDYKAWGFFWIHGNKKPIKLAKWAEHSWRCKESTMEIVTSVGIAASELISIEPPNLGH